MPRKKTERAISFHVYRADASIRLPATTTPLRSFNRAHANFRRPGTIATENASWIPTAMALAIPSRFQVARMKQPSTMTLMPPRMTVLVKPPFPVVQIQMRATTTVLRTWMTEVVTLKVVLDAWPRLLATTILRPPSTGAVSLQRRDTIVQANAWQTPMEMAPAILSKCWDAPILWLRTTTKTPQRMMALASFLVAQISTPATMLLSPTRMMEVANTSVAPNLVAPTLQPATTIPRLL